MHLLYTENDVSSSLTPGTSFVSRCSLVRLKAPALGAGDREFESHYRDQFSLLLFWRLVCQGRYCKLS
jgi:hypothetical protein